MEDETVLKNKLAGGVDGLDGHDGAVCHATDLTGWVHGVGDRAKSQSLAVGDWIGALLADGPHESGLAR